MQFTFWCSQWVCGHYLNPSDVRVNWKPGSIQKNMYLCVIWASATALYGTIVRSTDLSSIWCNLYIYLECICWSGWFGGVKKAHTPANCLVNVHKCIFYMGNSFRKLYILAWLNWFRSVSDTKRWHSAMQNVNEIHHSAFILGYGYYFTNLFSINHHTLYIFSRIHSRYGGLGFATIGLHCNNKIDIQTGY